MVSPPVTMTAVSATFVMCLSGASGLLQRSGPYAGVDTAAAFNRLAPAGGWSATLAEILLR